MSAGSRAAYHENGKYSCGPVNYTRSKLPKIFLARRLKFVGSLGRQDRPIPVGQRSRVHSRAGVTSIVCYVISRSLT